MHLFRSSLSVILAFDNLDRIFFHETKIQSRYFLPYGHLKLSEELLSGLIFHAPWMYSVWHEKSNQCLKVCCRDLNA